MLSKLKLVRGAVSKKDFTPILTHFRIMNGWIIGSNSRMTISVPCPELSGLDVAVPAEKFLKAIDACKSEPKFKVTDTGRLSITAGRFRALIPLGDKESYPLPLLRGNQVPTMEILPALRRVQKYIGKDISRAWGTGCLLKDNYIYATNNVSLVRLPVAWEFDPVTIPGYAVEELLRMRKEPIQIISDANNITFELEDQIWLQTRLIDAPWPDLGPMFDIHDYNSIPDIPDGLKEAVETIMPFCNDPKFPRIFLSEGGVSTEAQTTEAAITGFDLPRSIWRAEPLLKALSDAVRIDFSLWPSPCPFSDGSGLEGIIIGLKQTA